jgi:hypothetical protein
MIIPGAPQSPPAETLYYYPPQSAPPVPARPRRRFAWLLWAVPTVLISSGVVVVVVVLFGPQVMAGVADGVAAARTPAPTALAAASKQCGQVGRLGDGDKTLVLDMEGKKSGSGSMSVEQVTCVVKALDTPAFVVAEMDKTRALDGRQSQSWGSFEASWTYHPDDGLDIIVRQVK